VKYSGSSPKKKHLIKKKAAERRPIEKRKNHARGKGNFSSRGDPNQVTTDLKKKQRGVRKKKMHLWGLSDRGKETSGCGPGTQKKNGLGKGARKKSAKKKKGAQICSPIRQTRQPDCNKQNTAARKDGVREVPFGERRKNTLFSGKKKKEQRGEEKEGEDVRKKKVLLRHKKRESQASKGGNDRGGKKKKEKKTRAIKKKKPQFPSSKKRSHPNAIAFKHRGASKTEKRKKKRPAQKIIVIIGGKKRSCRGKKKAAH